jgi:Ion channel
MLTLLGGLVGVALIGTALFDALETIVVPRRVSRRLRVSRIFYWVTWTPYARVARGMRDGARREAFLSFFGPFSLLLLVALWALILVVGFAVIQWAVGAAVMPPDQQRDFGTDLYFSGTTFVTLGLGDVVPDSGIARVLTVMECGTGFAFLALLIGYLPVVYQLFARRETNVSLLDQRAGSPPSVSEFLRRNVDRGDLTELISALRDWEVWVGDLLESHLSYPTLAYFRSQHENQSWVSALAVILDVAAFVLACGGSSAVRQAGFTFAVARHAVGDLTSIFGIQPRFFGVDRDDATTSERLWQVARAGGLVGHDDDGVNARLPPIRALYEPYVQALADYLLMELPSWERAPGAMDNWETTAWDFTSPVPMLGPTSPFNKG